MGSFQGKLKRWLWQKYEKRITLGLWNKRGIANFLLLPLSKLYYALYKLHLVFKKVPYKRKDIFVICVGNVTVGGSGKTPIVLELMSYLLKYNIQAAFVTTGYGASLLREGNFPVVKVNSSKHSHREVGDEALLLARIAPTYISRSRSLGISHAADDGATVVILDDGLQDNIVKDYTILVINADVGFGNGLLLPAGPLREPLERGVAKADIVIILNGSIPSALEGLHSLIQQVRATSNDIEIISARIKPKEITKTQFKKSYIGLAGIAYPKRFFSLARIACFDIAEEYIFPDHHQYTISELNEIYSIATHKKCAVLTTTKDFARIPSAYHTMTEVFEIETDLDFSRLGINVLLQSCKQA